MALNALTLPATQGLIDRPFKQLVGGLTAGSERRVSSGFAGGFYMQGDYLCNDSLELNTQGVSVTESTLTESRTTDLTVTARREFAVKAEAELAAGTAIPDFRIYAKQNASGIYWEYAYNTANGGVVRGDASGGAANPVLPSVSRLRILGADAQASITGTAMMCVPAPDEYDAVQIMVYRSNPNSVDVVKASVIAPARFNDGVNGLDASGNAITPTPVTWPTVQSQSPYGLSGTAANTLVAGATAGANPPNTPNEARAYSNIIPIKSLARTDFPSRQPLLMVRVQGTNFPACASGSLSPYFTQGPTIQSVYPDLFCQYIQNADHVATASGVPAQTALGTTSFAPGVEIIFYLRDKKIATVASTGDSIDMGWGNTTAVNISAGNMNGWSRQFAQLRRASGKPTGHCAWHRDGFWGERFTRKALNAINFDDGLGVTHIFHKPSSVNNWRSDPNTVDADLVRTSELLAQASAKGTTVILVYPWAGQDIGGVPETKVRAYIDARKAEGAKTFDARALISADGSITSNVIADKYLTKTSGGAVVDTTHLNALAEADIAALALSQASSWGL